MFGLFRNKNKLIKEEYSFFKNVIDQLPVQYDFLKGQVTDEFLLGKRPNPLGEKGTYTFLLNANLESTFSSKTLPNFFIIKDIKIWNGPNKCFELIEFHILQGMLCGYLIKSKISNLDYTNMDFSNIKEKRFAEEDKDKLKEILGEIDQHVDSILDVSTTFRVDLEEGVYYVIKDFHDGNYLGISESGAVCLLMHDPYKVEQIFEDKDSFIDALTTGEFDVQNFYDAQFN